MRPPTGGHGWRWATGTSARAGCAARCASSAATRRVSPMPPQALVAATTAPMPPSTWRWRTPGRPS
eukprot:1587623-Lingulodinium_polyedra.AAC.1